MVLVVYYNNCINQLIIEKSMLLSNAIKKLEKAGYTLQGSENYHIASLNGVTITFTSREGKCSKFTFDSKNSCSPTYGMTLKQAMA